MLAYRSRPLPFPSIQENPCQNSSGHSPKSMNYVSLSAPKRTSNSNLHCIACPRKFQAHKLSPLLDKPTVRKEKQNKKKKMAESNHLGDPTLKGDIRKHIVNGKACTTEK